MEARSARGGGAWRPSVRTESHPTTEGGPGRVLEVPL